MRKHPSFIIAIPMYNEASYVERCVRSVNAVLREINIQNAIVTINDGSKDNTLEILEKLKPEFQRLNIINHEVNKGYGAGIKSAYEFGFENNFDYVLFMDADLTQNPSYIHFFIPYMEKNIDYIKASRYIEGSEIVDVPQYRKNISLVGNLIGQISFQLPITDYTNGFRAVKTSLSKQFNLESNNFEIIVEEIWQAKHLTNSFAELSYTLTSRASAEDSKFSYNLKVYRNYFKYCLFSLIRKKPNFINSIE